jgi:hypothetical protein
VSGPFATATEFCEFTGIAMPSDLARLQSHLDLASAMIRGFCAQMLSEVADEQVTLPSVKGTALILPERPVTAISSVLVNSAPVTDYWFTRAGVLYRGSVSGIVGVDWSYGATVTYTHGYAESDREFAVLRSVCIDVAARAFTMNERSASEAMGSTLMESAGYAPETFLTTGEKMSLADFGKVGVG